MKVIQGPNIVSSFQGLLSDVHVYIYHAFQLNAYVHVHHNMYMYSLYLFLCVYICELFFMSIANMCYCRAH